MSNFMKSEENVREEAKKLRNRLIEMRNKK
jgi:hypothetical protein